MRRHFLAVWFCAIALLAGVSLRSAGPVGASSGLIVSTTEGAVGGIAVGSENEWRGIPYAAPPVGALRWQPPAPVSPWTGVLDASQFAPPCIQLDFDNGGTLGSEDCLDLNVFAPSNATAGSNLAVMVHLHPGGNTFFHPYQDAAAFTTRNVIVVTVGYRLGVFGFVGHPALSAQQGGSSGEYGLLDQFAALHWVHDNIAGFGGDPSRVMLFGSSAGSFDTAALMASPLSQGLISAAAVQGDVLWGLTGQGNKISDGEQIGVQVSQSVGCQSAADVLACLRATPASDLVEAAGPLDIVPWVGGKVLPESPLQLVSERRTVPLLVGFDREEDATFQGNPIDAPYPTAKWIKDTNAMVGPSFGAAARALYPASSYDSLLWSFITMRTDAVRGCPTRRLANSVQAPVYRYLDTHVYENDPFFAQFRASHVFEDPFLWGSDVFGYGHTLTPPEQLLSQRMTDYWTNFAKTGDPNGPGLPTWPLYNTTNEPTLTLDDQIGVATNYHDAQCSLLDKIENIYPPPWAQAFPHLPSTPPGFLSGHARAFPASG